jgi:hypothetical protein
MVLLGFLLLARKALARYAAPMVWSAALVQQSQGQVVHLTDLEATASIDASSSRGFQLGSPAINVVKQQWFWFRIGTNGPEVSIDTISPPVVQQPDSRTLFVTYNNGYFGVVVEYVLTGGYGLDLAETVSIINATVAPIDKFHARFGELLDYLAGR